MKKKFLLSGLLGLTSMATAATAVVWSDDGATVTKEPAYSYTFDYGDVGASVDTTNVNGAKVLDFVAPAGKTSAGAGYGFGWQQNSTTYKDVPISLSAYKGVCMVYEAEAPFRIDFKQSTITDDNYYGMELPAAAVAKKRFIAFADLAQGWKSTTAKAWAVASQTGVQFSYKNTHASSAKTDNNEVILHSFTLADECVTAAPNLTELFAGYNGGSLELGEGKIHEIVLSEVFEDADGDDLKITVSVTSENNSIIFMNTEKSFTLADVLRFTTAPNPQGPASVVLTATDPTNKSVKFSFTFTTTDVENAPVAKNSSFTVNEDEVLKVGLSNRLTQYGSDADGDDIKLVLVSSTTHGVLDFDEENGLFTYTPDKNYNGYDTLSYKFVEVGNPESESEVALGIIEVKNVNDEPVVDVLAETFTDGEGNGLSFGDTLVVDEDFEPFTVTIPKASFAISDDDGDDDYKILAKASAVFNAALTFDEENYIIEVSAKKDSNGIGRLTLVVADPEVSIPTIIAFVKVNPVADPITPVADSYTVYQDSVNRIPAKTGVMANDLNPDKDTSAVAVLEVPAEHGVVVLEKDGSFIYEPEEGYVGEDAFGYKIESADSAKSKLTIVTLNVLARNKAPKIVDGVLDTVSNRLAALKEDFVSFPTYKKVEMQSWFTDDSTASTALKFTVRSADSLLAPTITSAGILQIKAVKDACGDAVVIVTAADARGATTDLELNASIQCVNDKPVVKKDTLYISEEWTGGKYSLSNIATDVDGDQLIYDIAETATNAEYFEWAVEGDSLELSLKEGAVLKDGYTFVLDVKVADSTMAAAASPTSLATKLTIAVVKDPDAIKPALAHNLQSWQDAIRGSRGMAAVIDMQGRVLWKSALPVSESEVRAAAASIQGRKILKVNQQVYTIK
ncbi:MAG: Ig-like domain-containing protein [Fibrobacter sp.]|nr:Ig-like domain-containing protein [Fibrobacter sp.]